MLCVRLFYQLRVGCKLKKVYLGLFLGCALFAGAGQLSYTTADFTDEGTSANNKISTGTLKLESNLTNDPLFFEEEQLGGDGLWQPGNSSDPKSFAIRNSGSIGAEIHSIQIIAHDFNSLSEETKKSLKKNLTFKVTDVVQPRVPVLVFEGTYEELQNQQALSQTRVLQPDNVTPKTNARYEVVASLSHDAGNELQGISTTFDVIFYANAAD